MFNILKNIQSCPYCGGKGMLLCNNKCFHIECENGCLYVGSLSTKQTLIERWNQECNLIENNFKVNLSKEIREKQ